MEKIYNRWLSNRNNSRYLNELNKDISNKKDIDPHKAQIIHEEVFQEANCLQCANCCKSIPPIVSERDSKRIAKDLNMTKAAFKQQYTITDEDGDMVMKVSPCPFLAEDNKCNIYKVRPAACREYPHSGGMAFYKNINHHKRNAKYCPALLEIIRRLAQATK